MNRKPLIFSCFCLAVLIALNLYVWFNLPKLKQYPIHWNAQGQADGFGSKGIVGLLLLMMPLILAAATLLFHYMPKLEPFRDNLENSRLAYHTTWYLTVALLGAVGGLIAMAYLSNDWAQIGASPRWVVLFVSVMFIGIGNVLGKVRRNFMMGIRTPWTLASDLSWEKTHRVGGRIFVLTGLVAGLSAIFTPDIAIAVMVTGVLGTTFFVVGYSFWVWKSDPSRNL